MSQQEVLDVLKKEDEIEMEELSKRLNLSLIAVWKNLNGLLKEGEVVLRRKTKEEVIAEGKNYRGRHYVYRLA